ncbi:MAG: hypothetical protein WAV92_12870 [Halopseudomonas yangmingensis]
MDYLIIAVVSFSGLYFHWWIYRRIQLWVRRDLALSMAGDDPQKRAWMLECLQQATRQKIRKQQLESWLREQSAQWDAGVRR